MADSVEDNEIRVMNDIYNGLQAVQRNSKTIAHFYCSDKDDLHLRTDIKDVGQVYQLERSIDIFNSENGELAHELQLLLKLNSHHVFDGLLVHNVENFINNTDTSVSNIPPRDNHNKKDDKDDDKLPF